MNNYKTKLESQESVILAIVMSIVIYFSMNFFSAILFIVPVPFIIYGVKSNLKSAILSLIASLLTIGIILDPFTSIALFLIYAPYIAISTYLIRKKYQAIKVIIYSALVLFSCMMIIYGALSIQGVDLISQLRENISQILSAQMEILSESGLTTFELLKERDSLRASYEVFLMIIPSTMIMSIFIFSYINYLLTARGLERIGIKISGLVKFSRFRLPNNYAIGTLVMIITAFIIRWMNISYAESIFINIIIIVGGLLFIQGLSVISYLLQRFQMKRLMKVITYMFIFLTPQSLPVITILGGMDIIFDFKKVKANISK